MLDGYAYFVICQKYDLESCKGYCASAEKIRRSQNLMGVFERWPGLQHVNSCKTYKEAQTIADSWNESYKANGTYAFL